MIKSKIMSYITQDFQSRSDLIVGGEEWQKVVLKMQSNLVLKKNFCNRFYDATSFE